MAKKSYSIAVIPGDGTGPEVVAEGAKVLKSAAGAEDVSIDLHYFDLGGERYLNKGEILPGSVLEELKGYDAIYLGAIGHPDVKPGVLEKGLLLRLRFELDQYINLRPVKLYPGIEAPIKDKGPEEIDYVVIRENTGGIYTGTGGISMKDPPHEVAVQSMVYNRHQVDRCLRFAYEYTRKRNKNKNLGLVGKTNVLTHVFDLWERAFQELGDNEYTDISRDYFHVDATCMWMIKSPEWFDVLVTSNMFGDIITDLGAITQGGMGIAAGGNINPEGVSMFEPIGGSAPKYTGKNLINPLAAISAAQMMIYNLGEHEISDRIENGIIQALQKDIKSLSSGKMGLTTSEVGDKVAGYAAS